MELNTDDLEQSKTPAPVPNLSGKADKQDDDGSSKAEVKTLTTVLHTVGMDGSYPDDAINKVQVNNRFLYDNVIMQEGLGLEFIDVEHVVRNAWTLSLLQERLGIEDEKELLSALAVPEESGFNDQRYDAPAAEIIDRILGKYTEPRSARKSAKAVFR